MKFLNCFLLLWVTFLPFWIRGSGCRIRILIQSGYGTLPPCAVLDRPVHDLLPDLVRHRFLLRAHAVVRAPIQHTLRRALHKHLRSGPEAGRLLGDAVAGHGLAVAGELQREILGPLGLHVATHHLGGLETASGLGKAVRVDLLAEGDERGLSGLADLKLN
jgi:hypothetical protein